MSRGARSPFTIHWDVVTIAKAHERTGNERVLLAVWPAPVNPDACFEAAGFTVFGDGDAGWERNTAMTVDRLLSALTAHGVPRLISVPRKRSWPLYLRLFISEGELPLPEQVKAPMFSDSVPPCEVQFGSDGVSLRTGAGHALWWVELPVAVDAAAFVSQVAGGLPVERTTLAWEHLL
jgi:hypothetical protein